MALNVEQHVRVAHSSSSMDRSRSSVGPDVHVVARRVVAADGERGAAAAAWHDRAPDGRGGAPHDLRRPLPDPGADHGRGGPPGAAAPAEEVLAVGPVRVLQRAVAAPRRRVPPRVARQPLVPLERAQPHGAARGVVRVQEGGLQARPLAARRGSGRGRAGLQDDGDQEEHRGGGRGHGGEAAWRHCEVAF
uniref:Uncharacterized protein n=1 Tax=Setaria italica TaxID=4555 RepID=K3YVX9_SETIT